MYVRGVGIQPTCLWCPLEREYEGHLFKTCSFAGVVEQLYYIIQSVEDYLRRDPKDLMEVVSGKEKGRRQLSL
ncbi:hypothetical protein TSUD_208230 [Trifolium subterraneum]|uniref:Uncharacterized protein n=1 Tax=Trifolium subterraneum TaxID=3900 RepID=A0A2Z6N1U0_TRISU|nr:hypothetical protein TSUD_208230 [Trifolium subterraneum]